MGDWTIERVVHNQSFARASRVRVKILRQTLLKLFKKIKHTVLSVGSIFYRYLPCKVRQSRWKTGENQPCLPSRPGANFFLISLVPSAQNVHNALPSCSVQKNRASVGACVCFYENIQFSRTSLFSERFWSEFWIFFKFHKPVSNFNRPKNEIFCLLITLSFLSRYVVLLRMRS